MEKGDGSIFAQEIIQLAARNYQPVTLRGWKETQESGYLGEPKK